MKPILLLIAALLVFSPTPVSAQYGGGCVWACDNFDEWTQVCINQGLAGGSACQTDFFPCGGSAGEWCLFCSYSDPGGGCIRMTLAPHLGPAGMLSRTLVEGDEIRHACTQFLVSGPPESSKPYTSHSLLIL